MFKPNEIRKMPESYLYENEELIKTCTTQEYEQEGGEILIDCKCMECYMNHEKKSRHVQLETGKSYCENTGERRKKPKCFQARKKSQIRLKHCIKCAKISAGDRPICSATMDERGRKWLKTR